MLQIASGKLFTRDVGWTNQIRGVLYTNGDFGSNDLSTAAGCIRSTGGERGNLAVVYELSEKMEAEEEAPGVLVSSGATPYMRDFAVLASFFLEIIVSTDVDIVRRLTNDSIGFAANSPPKSFVSGVFEKRCFIAQGKREEFIEFSKNLIDLDRNHFLAAMRAMKTYVAALHSIPDDPGLSYTLLVSSVETLVQDFDGFIPEWTDVSQDKRETIDGALEGASDQVATAVRAAVLTNEHHAMARRYRDFIISRTGRDYFRSPTLKTDISIARNQLRDALGKAYDLRSKYIHSAQPLPDAIANPFGHQEHVELDRRPALTLQGLARLSRHVIASFVAGGPFATVEKYDYHLERYGISVMPLAPQYWVGKPLIDAKQGRSRLEGFLRQLSQCDLGDKSAKLTDLRAMLADAEKLLPQAKKDEKPYLYVLYALFNCMVSETMRFPNWEDFLKKHAQVAEPPSSAILIGRTILNSTDGWGREVHESAFIQYWSQRNNKNGLKAPRLYEAATALSLAERFRIDGCHDKALELISQAVECHPGHSHLREFENGYSQDMPINWRSILIGQTEDESEADKGD